METLSGFDARTPARIQLAFTAAWRCLFQVLTTGLASYRCAQRPVALARRQNISQPVSPLGEDLRDLVCHGRPVRHRDVGPVRDELIGVLGLAGPVVGPLMAQEVLTAFFLEAGFLALMLFGRERGGP